MIISIQTDEGVEIDAITLEHGLGVESGSTPGSFRLTYDTSFVLCKMLVDAGVRPFSVGQIKVNVETPDPKKILLFKKP